MYSIDSDIAAIGRIDVVPKILDVVCRTTGMGFAAVARVTGERWVACAVKDDIAFGLKPGGELELTSTICDEIRLSGVAVVIDHVAEDPDFRDHHTPAQYGFQSYISTPIRCDGQFFGTLCAIDPDPARLRTPEIIGMFELFADMIGSQLEIQQRLARSQAALLDAQATSELRDQFIAVLGHDLRNPLAAIDGGVRLLNKTPLNERGTWVVGEITKSVARMADLIDDVLDFARGRLGGGIGIERRENLGLAESLEEVVNELRTGNPTRVVISDIRLSQAPAVDIGRINQLLSNLVGNALTHGAKDQPVRIEALDEGGVFRVSVANGGAPIPADTAQRLFQPFVRISSAPTQGGLGLGLYIASEIARAHGGTLTVTSDEHETRFTFAMPIAGT
ncbi:GAF domain-containing sensor histidine kinase [Caulobacter sp. FWC2]|uniref:GAF domain-containing sensor histidine kinase n=1 Tax=Caulobacter sp. FWC2 TaxID=69664 RepID=UPI0018EE04E0|nr:GAF domain-containing sensor histidine kinase [Caulobacter sp. FWC2]